MYADPTARLKSGAELRLPARAIPGAPRFSPYRTLGEIKPFGSLALPLLDCLHFQIIPERFWNLNGAVSLLIGFDQRDE